MLRKPAQNVPCSPWKIKEFTWNIGWKEYRYFLPFFFLFLLRKRMNEAKRGKKRTLLLTFLRCRSVRQKENTFTHFSVRRNTFTHLFPLQFIYFERTKKRDEINHNCTIGLCLHRAPPPCQTRSLPAPGPARFRKYDKFSSVTGSVYSATPTVLITV